MVKNIEEEFEDLKENYYPGSKRIKKSVERKSKSPPKKEVDHDWREEYKVFKIGDKEKEFYTIGSLARAVGKKPVTVRLWINSGLMPETKFRTPKTETGVKGRRLWTRRQIEEIAKAAKEELPYHKVKNFSQTNFSDRLHAIMTDSELAIPDTHFESKGK